MFLTVSKPVTHTDYNTVTLVVHVPRFKKPLLNQGHLLVVDMVICPMIVCNR